MADSGTRTAFIIGGTGQIGSAATERLIRDGWRVTVAHRGTQARTATDAPAKSSRTLRTPDEVQTVLLDRDDTDALLRHARGHDLVLDTVAYTPAHADQLVQLAGDVGSLVVISTASVSVDGEGRTLDTATGPDDFPDYPVPLTEENPITDSDEQTYSPLKAAMERRLLATDGLPVSILRPGAIHGPFSPALREWFFVKRVRDGRHRVVLCYDGESRFATTATVNLAELIALCADQPGVRVLNAIDEETPSVTEIGRTIFAAMGHEVEILTFPGPPRDRFGAAPWSVPKPMVLSMRKAQAELGYRQPVSYADAVATDIRWVTDAVNAARARGETWQDLFPALTARYGADDWFDYVAEDAFAAAHAED